MLKFRNFHGFLILLLVGNLVFTTIFLIRRVDAGSVVLATGTIGLYNSDGMSLFTEYYFPLFVGGITETALKVFFINNTGTRPVYVYWNISESSILWILRNPNQDRYDYSEDNTRKYSLGIRRSSSPPVDYWHPDIRALYLGPSEGVKLSLELHYTGEPKTAEIFTMTLSFYATDENPQDLLVEALEDLKTEINGLPSEAFKLPQLAELQKSKLCNQIDRIIEEIQSNNFRWASQKLKWLKMLIDKQILDPYKTTLIEEIDEILSIL